MSYQFDSYGAVSPPARGAPRRRVRTDATAERRFQIEHERGEIRAPSQISYTIEQPESADLAAPGPSLSYAAAPGGATTGHRPWARLRADVPEAQVPDMTPPMLAVPPPSAPPLRAPPRGAPPQGMPPPELDPGSTVPYVPPEVYIPPNGTAPNGTIPPNGMMVPPNGGMVPDIPFQEGGLAPSQPQPDDTMKWVGLGLLAAAALFGGWYFFARKKKGK